MEILKGKNLLLCVGGGISAYKSVELLRLLKKEGANVNVIMSEAGEKFVGRLTFQTLSENPVLVDMFDLYQGVEVKHVKLPAESHLVVVAPATADIIGKLANGIANDLLSTTLLVASPKKILLCPAMNTWMWENEVVKENIERLLKRGVNIIEPGEGELACGFVGKGRMREPEEILNEIKRLLSPQDMKGMRVMVTAGPTREFIDDVRFLSNPSSGKMGYAFAKVARWRGADVHLISGPVSLSPPYGVKTQYVISADEMLERVKERIKEIDLLIKTAAVCDFKPQEKIKGKIKKEEGVPNLKLQKTKDILKEIAGINKKAIIVGFSAEVSSIKENALKKLKEKGIHFIVANDISRKDVGFESDYNEGYLITQEEVLHIEKCSKEEFAWKVLDEVLRRTKKG